MKSVAIKFFVTLTILSLTIGMSCFVAPRANATQENLFSEAIIVQAATKSINKQAKKERKKIKKALKATKFVLTHKEVDAESGKFGFFAEQSQYSLDVTCKPKKGKLVYRVELVNAYTGDKVESLKSIKCKKVVKFLRTIDKKYL